MLSITLQNKEYSIRDKWEEVTLDEFIHLSKLPAPEKLIDLYKIGARMNTGKEKERKKAEQDYDTLTKEFTVEDQYKIFPGYYGKVIKLFSNIPVKVINKMHRDVRENIFNNHLKQYVLSLFYVAPVDIIGGEITPYSTTSEGDKIKVGREIFYLPESLKLDNEVLPNHRTDILTFSEAASIETVIHELKEDTDKMARFCAVYLRKKGEKYSDEMVLKREPLMRRMNMDSVWRVFFCIMQHSKRSLIYILMFSSTQEINERIRQAGLEAMESEA